MPRSSSIRIAELFALAETLTASETERLQAINELLGEYRSQLEQRANKEMEDIDPLLLQGIKLWGLRIFARPNPVLALERFLGLRRPRGKRASNGERNIQMAIAVLEKMNAGMSLEDAAADVAENNKFGGKLLGADSIVKIYKRHHREAKAEIACSALEKET